jgi:hypothetical protein
MTRACSRRRDPDRDAVRPQPDRDLASPAEHATDADCAAGVEALAAVLEELACR